MIKPTSTITTIKKNIQELYNKAVTVKLNLGRNKFVTYPAVLSGVYPAIFTVNPVQAGFLGRTSFSYSEILCGKVFILPTENKS